MDAGLKPSSEWTDKIVDSIIAGRSVTAVDNFKKQPLANKLTAVENAVVQPRRDNTPDTIADILRELLRMGAIRSEEMGPMFSDLLIRVHKFNSTNVQANLNTLLHDIRTAQSEAIRTSSVGELSNQVVLNQFLTHLNPVVPMGQQNFEAFKQSLRLMVNEAPNVTVFKSGPDTMLQVNIRGVNTVNLNDAFKNLYHLWGVTLDSELVPGNISSKLSSNTRVLMLFLAPFTNELTFSPDTFISQLMRLYRETVSASLEFPEETEREVEETVRDLGVDSGDITRTMAYLLKNREEVLQAPRTLSPRQLNVLRYIQESLVDRIDRNGEDPEAALSNVVFSFAPSYFEANGPFIGRLMSYFEVALRNSPNYFREIYTNKYWTPPASFWTQNYGDFFLEREVEAERKAAGNVAEEAFEAAELPPELPEEEPEFLWDDYDDFGTARSPSVPPPPSVRSAPASLSYAPTTAPSLTSDSTVGRNIGATLARAVIPPAAAAIGSAAGNALYPSLGNLVAPAASAVATRLLNLSKTRKQRLRRLRDRNYRRISETRHARPAPASSSGSLESVDFRNLGPVSSTAPSSESGETVYGALPGALSVYNPLMTPEGDARGTGLNYFRYLRPKRGLY